MTEYIPLQDAFRAALRLMLDKHKLARGAQKELIEKIANNGGRITKDELSKIVNGKRPASEKRMEMIAHSYHYSLIEFLSLGEAHIKGRNVFPYEKDIEGKSKEEQAELLIDEVKREMKLTSMMDIKPQALGEFLNGEMSVEEFYEEFKRELKTLIESIKNL